MRNLAKVRMGDLAARYPRNFRAASSSARRSRGRCAWIRRSCCSTSPPPRWIPSSSRKCASHVQLAEDGRTIIVATHEAELVHGLAPRMVLMADGRDLGETTAERFLVASRDDERAPNATTRSAHRRSGAATGAADRVQFRRHDARARIKAKPLPPRSPPRDRRARSSSRRHAARSLVRDGRVSECIVDVDGLPSLRACTTPVTGAMVVTAQGYAADVPVAAAARPVPRRPGITRSCSSSARARQAFPLRVRRRCAAPR